MALKPTLLAAKFRLTLLKEVEAVGVGRTDTGFKGDGFPVPTSLPFIRRAGAATGVPLSRAIPALNMSTRLHFWDV